MRESYSARIAAHQSFASLETRAILFVLDLGGRYKVQQMFVLRLPQPLVLQADLHVRFHALFQVHRLQLSFSFTKSVMIIASIEGGIVERRRFGLIGISLVFFV